MDILSRTKTGFSLGETRRYLRLVFANFVVGSQGHCHHQSSQGLGLMSPTASNDFATPSVSPEASLADPLSAFGHDPMAGFMPDFMPYMSVGDGGTNLEEKDKSTLVSRRMRRKEQNRES